MNLPSPAHRLMHTMSGFWNARNQRERVMLSAAFVAVALSLFYALLIEPAVAGRKHLSKDLPLLRQQVAQLQAMTKQAAAYSGKPVPSVSSVSREMITAGLASKSLKLQSLLLTGDYAKVQLADVSFANTLSWLNEVQSTALLFVVDANVIALNQPDRVDVTLTLRQTGNE